MNFYHTFLLSKAFRLRRILALSEIVNLSYVFVTESLKGWEGALAADRFPIVLEKSHCLMFCQLNFH